MIHKCTQEQKITDLQKSFNDLDKRDALKANENKNMSEQIKAIKDTVSNVENKLDKWFEEIKLSILQLERKYVTRLEFKAVSIAIWTVATVLGIVWVIKSFTP
jgi:predicted  nucleic acid-binding Zn-ribbon protein